MKTPHENRAGRTGLAFLVACALLALLSAARAGDATPKLSAEKQIAIDEASRALASCTVAAARQHQAEITPETLGRVVIGDCVEAHGRIVELTWGLATPTASRIMLMATVDALDAARRAVAD